MADRRAPMANGRLICYFTGGISGPAPFTAGGCGGGTAAMRWHSQSKDRRSLSGGLGASIDGHDAEAATRRRHMGAGRGLLPSSGGAAVPVSTAGPPWAALATSHWPLAARSRCNVTRTWSLVLGSLGACRCRRAPRRSSGPPAASQSAGLRNVDAMAGAKGWQGIWARHGQRPGRHGMPHSCSY